MAKKVCKECGKEYVNESNSNPWYECSGCGTYHCPDCLQENMDLSDKYKQKKAVEKEKELEQLASKGDINTYKRKLCPNCEFELTRMI